MKNYQITLLHNNETYAVKNSVMRMGDNEIVAFYKYKEGEIGNTSGDLILMIHMRNCMISEVFA